MLTQLAVYRKRQSCAIGLDSLSLRFRTLTLAVALVQLAIDGLAADVQQARRARLVTGSVIERRFDGLPLDVVQRRWNIYFELGRTTFTRGLRSFSAKHCLPSRSYVADGGGQVLELDLPSRSDDHGSFD